MNLKESEGIYRNLKESKGIWRNLKEIILYSMPLRWNHIVSYAVTMKSYCILIYKVKHDVSFWESQNEKHNYHWSFKTRNIKKYENATMWYIYTGNHGLSVFEISKCMLSERYDIFIKKRYILNDIIEVPPTQKKRCRDW